jgi:dihydrofolate reductase
MRRVIFGGANSLDNYIARSDGGVDWLKWNKEVAEIGNAFWKTVDTVVIGRKTYDAGLKLGTSSFPGVKNYVVSRTLERSEHKSIELVRGDAVEFVRRLKNEDGKGICIMSGGNFARSLLEADLIDEIGINVHPVLLGQGLPLFYEMTRPIDLELLECRQLKNGCVVLRYEVLRRSAK